jgi:primosomal protein N' (replication factor Y)
MKYAEVSVNSPVAQRRTFSYAIPNGLDVREGQAVLVPFGQKILQGVVLELTSQPAVADTREVIDIIEPEPVLSRPGLALARWISTYYLAPLFEAVALMLPPGFERPARTFVKLAWPDTDVSSLDDESKRVVGLLAGQDRVDLKKLQKKLGQKKAQAVISRLVRQGTLHKSGFYPGYCRFNTEADRPGGFPESTVTAGALGRGQAADRLRKSRR